MSQGAGAAAGRKKTGRKWPRWFVVTLWSLLGLLAATGLVAFLTVQFGAVYGVELNPYTFARRSYSLYEIPLIRLQVRGIRREDVAGVAAEFLAAQKYIRAAKGAPDVWHVVTATRGKRQQRLGDADILVRYLDSQDDGSYHVWVAWSEKHPELAKVLWPAVSRLAQEEMYVFVPDLFEQARRASDPVVFQRDLNRTVSGLLFDVARRLQSAGEDASAKKLLDDAAKLNPTDPLIKRAKEMADAKAPTSKAAPISSPK
jgi:hypothetical protein